jgi:hypothetical protein
LRADEVEEVGEGDLDVRKRLKTLHPAVARPGRAAANIEFDPLPSHEAPRRGMNDGRDEFCIDYVKLTTEEYVTQRREHGFILSARAISRRVGRAG